MTPPARPSPDALLKAARRDARGKLKILLGAAPGVGKTCEMLREGAELGRQGRDVVIGLVETHGRAETEALIGGLEVLPRRVIRHGAHDLAEFNLDAMLARRPDVALVDEFAHSNAPGSRHPKRWQDIEELRDAGIDVLTTLNIQHVESLSDVVAGFTRVRVRETVPDAALEDAEIEVVDIPPDELIERLKAGKVYIPHEATRALGHYFSKSNLSALREMALRRAAQAVDRSLIDHVAVAGEGGNWAAGERVVVAVGDQPGSDRLIRAAKRYADAMRASWSAVSVETPRSARLGEAAKARTAEALKLAASLGATIATVAARSVTEGLRAHMAETRATTLVIGKSRRSWLFELRHGSVVDELVRELDGVAVHVVPVALAPADEAAAAGPVSIAPGKLAAALAMVAATTLGAEAFGSVVGANAIDLIYLLPVIASATLLGLRVSLVTSLVAALAYNFFFLPPLYTLTISDPQNVVTLLVFAAVAVVASQLAGRLRRVATLGARTATENAAIAAFGQRLAAASDEATTARAVCEEVAGLLDVATVLLARREGQIAVVCACPERAVLGPLELAAAEWAFERGEVAGRDSGTLTASEWQFHPLQTALGVLGVLGIAANGTRDPLPAARRVLFTTLLGQAALAHERLKLAAEALELGTLREREALHTTVLSSIGHDLKTPLTAVMAAADALAAEHGESANARTLKAEARRLRRVFDDLVEMTRIEAGAIVVHAEATDLTDAVAAAVHDLRAELTHHRLVLDVPPSLPLVEADPRMLHHVLVNLLGNAAKFAPRASTITVAARREPGALVLAVRDQGPGLPPGQAHSLFDRFARLDGNDMTGGTGLGLAIVKGFAQAMGLGIAARNASDGGALFELTWDETRLRKSQP